MLQDPHSFLKQVQGGRGGSQATGSRAPPQPHLRAGRTQGRGRLGRRQRRVRGRGQRRLRGGPSQVRRTPSERLATLSQFGQTCLAGQGDKSLRWGQTWTVPRCRVYYEVACSIRAAVRATSLNVPRRRPGSNEREKAFVRADMDFLGCRVESEAEGSFEVDRYFHS